eukprot:scaffold926_cov408-Prasinococcus_capsulatus_cf.AAC.36
MGCIVILLVRALSSYVLSIKAARNLHEALLKGVLGAPMSFFHTTPTGRIMNRFSQDTYTVDERLCDTLSSFTMQTFQVVATIAAIGYATPYFLIVVPFILIFYRYSLFALLDGGSVECEGHFARCQQDYPKLLHYLLKGTEASRQCRKKSYLLSLHRNDEWCGDSFILCAGG